jgi:UDP-glucose 4-epimerase
MRELGWSPKYVDIRSIVETAWAWHSSHPDGYAQDH